METLPRRPEETARGGGWRFAQQQLKKRGWREGKGLGKQENGISEALKVKIKCDKAGVGHNSAEQFTNHWWDHLFNSSAANIVVETGQEGVQMRKLAEGGQPATSKGPSRAPPGKMLYSGFVKAATLVSGREESLSPAPPESHKEQQLPTARLTDEELFQACGGRTGHKGARHGFTMSAKLARLEEQEATFLAGRALPKAGEAPVPGPPPAQRHHCSRSGRGSLAGEEPKRKRKKKKAAAAAKKSKAFLTRTELTAGN